MIRFSLKVWIVSVLIGSILASLFMWIIYGDSLLDVDMFFVSFMLSGIGSCILSVPALIAFVGVNKFLATRTIGAKGFRVKSALAAMRITVGTVAFFSGDELLFKFRREPFF